MSGRGCVAGVVGTTSLRDCKGNTSGRCVRRTENGILAHRPQAVEKSGSLRRRDQEVALASRAAQQAARSGKES